MIHENITDLLLFVVSSSFPPMTNNDFIIFCYELERDESGALEQGAAHDLTSNSARNPAVRTNIIIINIVIVLILLYW